MAEIWLRLGSLILVKILTLDQGQTVLDMTFPLVRDWCEIGVLGRQVSALSRASLSQVRQSSLKTRGKGANAIWRFNLCHLDIFPVIQIRRDIIRHTFLVLCLHLQACFTRA